MLGTKRLRDQHGAARIERKLTRFVRPHLAERNADQAINRVRHRSLPSRTQSHIRPWARDHTDHRRFVSAKVRRSPAVRQVVNRAVPRASRRPMITFTALSIANTGRHAKLRQQEHQERRRPREPIRDHGGDGVGRDGDRSRTRTDLLWVVPVIGRQVRCRGRPVVDGRSQRLSTRVGWRPSDEHRPRTAGLRFDTGLLGQRRRYGRRRLPVDQLLQPGLK